MDVVAHTLWTNALFYAKYAHDRRRRYWAAFFGVLPDLVAFAPVFVVMAINQVFNNVTVANYMDAYVNSTGVHAFAVGAYNYTHSFLIFLIVFAITALILSWRARKLTFYWPLLGWGLHVVIDIFTHPDFFRTPFLFPLSDFKNNHGVSWAHPTFMAINYACLIIVYIAIWHYQRRKAGNPVS